MDTQLSTLLAPHISAPRQHIHHSQLNTPANNSPPYKIAQFRESTTFPIVNALAPHHNSLLIAATPHQQFPIVSIVTSTFPLWAKSRIVEASLSEVI